MKLFIDGLQAPCAITFIKYLIAVIGDKRCINETGLRQSRSDVAVKGGVHCTQCSEHIKTDGQGSVMFFLNRDANWNNRDYRDYRDHRARQKRLLRLRMSIGLTLMVCMLLMAAWLPTVSV
jgi:hypothetical protein